MMGPEQPYEFLGSFDIYECEDGSLLVKARNPNKEPSDFYIRPGRLGFYRLLGFRISLFLFSMNKTDSVKKHTRG